MSKNPTGNEITKALVAQMTNPKGASIIRWPQTNGRPSATAQPYSRPVLNWSTSQASAGKLVLPADESIIIMSRDPLAPIIQEDKNPSAVALNQVWLIADNPAVSSIPVGAGQKAPLEKDLYASTPNGAANPWHGSRLFARSFKGRYYLWCDCGQTSTAAEIITLATGTIPMAAGDKVTFTVYRLNEGNELQVSSVEVAGPVAASSLVTSVQLTGPDYYRVEIYANPANTTANLNFGVGNAATSAIMVHKALPDLVERQMDLVQSIRIIGAACDIKDTASDNNAAGSWVGDQIEGSILWTAFLRGASGANGFQLLSTQRGNEIIELKKNGYMFLAPDDVDDLQYVHPFTFNSTPKVSNVKNQDFDGFNYFVMYLKAGGQTLAQADPARSIQMLCDWTLEYLSEGQWPMNATSPATAEQGEAAVRIIGSMEQVHTNPSFKDILSTIGKYARLSAPVLSMLGPYGRAAGIVAGGVGNTLGKLGYRTKKTARPEEIQGGDAGGAEGQGPEQKRGRGAAEVPGSDVEMGHAAGAGE